MPITEEVSFGRGIVFTGSKSCSAIKACDEAIDWSNWNQSPNPGQQYDVCMQSGCQAGADAYSDFDNCRYTHCKDECLTFDGNGGVIDFKFDDPACTSCATANCAPQRDACVMATCP
jgi:hypothetical protein